MKNDSSQDYPESDSKRDLRVVFAGSRKLGVFADEIEAITDWRTPTPLPHAPKAVLGVVCIHGRMLTVLDIAALLGERVSVAPSSPACIVALRGDEQLALAVDRAGETIALAADELQDTKNDERSLMLGFVDHGGESITVLNVRELFPAAIRGHERRRRRF
jgi:purine-binding chemotaxis protein CheW